MANGRSDIRVDDGMPDNVKVMALCAALGDGAGFCLVRLWCYAGKRHPSGKFPSPDAIEQAARWTGEPGAFHAALVRLRLLEPDGVTLHDWPEEQPFVFGRAERVVRARRAGEASAAKRNGRPMLRLPNGMFGPTERVVRTHRTPTPSPTETESAAVQKPAATPSSERGTHRPAWMDPDHAAKERARRRGTA